MILSHNALPKYIDGTINIANCRVSHNATSIKSENIDSLLSNSRSDKTTPICLKYGDESLRFQDGKVSLSGPTDGAIYNQLANLASFQEQYPIHQNMELNDKPNTPHREFMLDIARNYIPLEEIKIIVDELFRNRINFLHLHISDDQNYGIESIIHPELNTKNCLSIKEIKELIQYCHSRGIEIIPEFDVPGHLFHLLEINPTLRCNPNEGNSLCFGKNHDYNFDLIDELCEIFPSKFFHIGADELGLKNQCKCKDCRALMAKKGFTSFKELAADFINEVAYHVQQKGKTVIAWNDALRYGRINEDVIIQKWFNYYGDNTCLEEANNGRKIIVASATDTYFDIPYSLTPLRKTYNYAPEVNDTTINPYGVSSHLWTEVICEKNDLERHIFPRLQAFGENAWLNPDFLDYKSFLLRLKEELARLKSMDINYEDLTDADKFSLKETMDFLHKKMYFKNYTDFRMIDLLKMAYGYTRNRKK